jgi:Ni,Fe-hydrogenase III large subunit
LSNRRTIIPFGPQHPVLPEPIQLRLVLEDEKVIEALPAIGYVHRGLEKLAEQKDYLQDVYLIERICGICSFMHSLNYCQGIEEIMAVDVPARARYLRVIWSELHRMHSHLLFLGLLADAFGFENLFMQGMRCREDILDVMELTTGNRILLTTCRIGGVRKDITADQLGAINQALDRVGSHLAELGPAFANNYTIKKRLIDVGVLSREKAHELGAVGPVAKASGIATDLRETGYAAYGDLGFQPITETAGDSYARMMVRPREPPQSMELGRQAIARLPEGPISVPVKGNPNGETVARMEQPRGELLFFIKGNGTKNLDRFRARTPTFANLPGLLHMLPGCQFADVPVIVISIDPCISCTER